MLNLNKINYSANPFPNFFTDEIINDKLGEELLKFWPDNISNSEWDEMNIRGPVFRLESINAWKQLSSEKRVFWKSFILQSFDYIRNIYNFYKPYFDKKFNNEIDELFISSFSLTEFGSDPKLEVGGHHHFAEGTWLFTILIHIGEDDSERGNSLFGIKNESKNSFEEILSNNFPGNVDNTKLLLKRKIEFKKNRLFSFLETPISIHGMDKSIIEKSKNINLKRRMIRIHVSAKDSLIKHVSDLNKNDYRNAIDKSDGSEKIKKIYGKQINILKDSINSIGKKLYTSDINIKGIHGAEIAPYWTTVPLSIKKHTPLRIRSLIKKLFS